MTMKSNTLESKDDLHPPRHEQQQETPAAGSSAGTITDIDQEQHEYVAYQQSQRRARQLFVSPFVKRGSTLRTIASQRISEGLQLGRGFQARADSSPNIGTMPSPVQSQLIIPAAGIVEYRNALAETAQTISRP
eukprot:IDg8175t1